MFSNNLTLAALLDFHICHRPHQRKGRTIDVFKTQLVHPTTLLNVVGVEGADWTLFPPFFTLSGGAAILPFIFTNMHSIIFIQWNLQA